MLVFPILLPPVPLTLERSYDSLLAAFQESQETPYVEDEPVLSRKRILDDLEEIENRYGTLMLNAVERETWALVNKTKSAVKAHDLKVIQAAKTSTANAINPLLYSLWRDGWALGWKHAQEEIKILNATSFNLAGSEQFITFAERKGRKKKRKPPIRRAKYPIYGETVKMEDTAMRGAIEQRTVRVAQDLDETTRQEITQHLAAAADPKDPISGKELERRIESSLGKQQFKRSDVSAKDVQKEYRRGGFKRRAQMIATTELMSAYNLAKLSALRTAGFKRVRWQTFEPPIDVCETCWSRNGTVHYIDDLIGARNRLITLQYQPARPTDRGYDPRQYVIPAHPSCRCTWVGVPEGELDDPGRNPRNRNPFPLKGLWASVLTGAIGLGALYLVLGQQAIGRAVGRAITSRQGRLVGETAVDIAEGISELPEQLPQDRPGRVRPTFVGDIDINRASTNLLRTRYNLDEEQARALRKSLIDNPIDDINDLARRIERGDIPGLTPEVFQSKILSTQPLPPTDLTIRLGSLLDSAAIASGGAKEGAYLDMVKESLRGLQISPGVSEEIYREFFTSEKFFSSADELRVRLANRGVQISDREMEIIRTNFVFSPSTLSRDVWDGMKRTPGVGGGSRIVGEEDVLPDYLPTTGVIGGRGTARSDLFQNPDEWPFIGKQGAEEERRLLQEGFRKMKAKVREVFPDYGYPEDQPVPPRVRRITAAMRRQLGQINSLKGQIDVQTEAVRRHLEILRKYGYDVLYKKDAPSGRIIDIQLVESEGGITLTRAQQRRSRIALENLRESHNKRDDLVTNLYDQVFELQRTDTALQTELGRYRTGDAPSGPNRRPPETPPEEPGGSAPVRRTPPPDDGPDGGSVAEAPPAAPLPTTPTVGGPRPEPDPVNVENNAWALARDEMIRDGIYNSSAAEYKSFDTEVAQAGRRKMNEWKAIRRDEKIQGSKIDFAKRQFPRMSQYDYREAARQISDLEDAVNSANTQKFVKAYSQAMLAKDGKGGYLVDAYPEFKRFLEERYASATVFDRIARHFGVRGRTPHYNPRYFSDEAVTGWFDVGRDIEDEWRKAFREGALERMPQPTIIRPRSRNAVEAQPVQESAPSEPVYGYNPKKVDIDLPYGPITSVGELKDAVQDLTGQNPKNRQDAHKKFWDHFWKTDNIISVSDDVGYRMADETQDITNADGDTYWYQLFDMADGRYLVVQAYDGGNVGDGHILAGNDPTELWEYFFQKDLKFPREIKDAAEEIEEITSSLPAPSPRPTGEINPETFSAPNTPLRDSAVSIIMREPENAKTAVSQYSTQKRWLRDAGMIDSKGNHTLEGAIASEYDQFYQSPVTGAIMIANLARQENGVGWLLRHLDEYPSGQVPANIAWDYNNAIPQSKAQKIGKQISRVFDSFDFMADGQKNAMQKTQLFYRPDSVRIQAAEKMIRNPYVLAYALAKEWEDLDLGSSHLHEYIFNETRFTAMAVMKKGWGGIERGYFQEALNLMEVHRLIEQRRTVPPWQIIKRWGSLEDLIRKAYEYEAETGLFQSGQIRTVVEFKRPWRRWRKHG